MCVSRAAQQIKQATALDPPAPRSCERDVAPGGKRARSWRHSPHVWIALTSHWIHSARFKPVQGKTTTFYIVTRYPRAQDLSGSRSRQRPSPPGLRWRRLGLLTGTQAPTAHCPHPRSHHPRDKAAPWTSKEAPQSKILTISNLSTPKMKNTKGKSKIKSLNKELAVQVHVHHVASRTGVPSIALDGSEK